MIEIRHNRTDGTYVEGTSRSDRLLLGSTKRGGLGLRWDSENERWYQRHSRNRSGDRGMIQAIEKVLTEAGHTVSVEIDDTTPAPSFADREAERYSRAESRAESHDRSAGNAAASSTAAYNRVRQIGERFAFGQPILVGHHSEGRARRDQQRMHDGMRRSIEEDARAQYHADRAEAAGRFQARRESVPTTLRRIKKIEARRRAIVRELAGRDEYQGELSALRRVHVPCGENRAAVLRAEDAELVDELTYWQQHIKEQEEAGVKVWRRADFSRGDFVRHSGTWFEIITVNQKSVTIPALVSPTTNGIVLATDPLWTHVLAFDEIHGHRTRETLGLPALPQPGPRRKPRAVPASERPAPGSSAAPLDRLLALAPGFAALLGDAGTRAVPPSLGDESAADREETPCPAADFAASAEEASSGPGSPD